jgi:predicted O-methyltransferase YrrM
MTNDTKQTIADFFGLIGGHWMMTPAERFAIVGLLEILRPRQALEIGYGHGGFTRHLSRFAGEVDTVDIDTRVGEAAKRFPNVRGWQMSSAAAWAKFQADSRRFDFCLIDADHSPEGTYADLRMAVRHAEVIVLHDTANPGCRSGYVRALAEADVYANLDWVDGHIQCDGVWGGFGVVLTAFPANQPYCLSPIAKLNYDLIQQEWARAHA